MKLHELYEYDNTIFDEMIWPDGVDVELMCQTILTEGGTLTCLYNEPYFAKMANRTWSKKNLLNFTKAWKALNTEYAPLENYDRHVESSRDVTDRGTYGSNTTTGTVSQVAPFNTESWNNENKLDGNTTVNGSTGNTRNDGYWEHTHGNIGVTTSQQMLMSELELDKMNYYDYVVGMYIRDNLIGVY